MLVAFRDWNLPIVKQMKFVWSRSATEIINMSIRDFEEFRSRSTTLFKLLKDLNFQKNLVAFHYRTIKKIPNVEVIYGRVSQPKIQVANKMNFENGCVSQPEI